MNPNGSKIRDTIIKMAKIKDKEKTLKTARGEKKTVILKQILIRPSTNFFAQNWRPDWSCTIYLKYIKRRKTAT